MARLIYAVLALALAALVAGFVVRTSSVPLIVSISLSAVVAVLILYGHSRRLRQSGALGGEVDEPPEPSVEEIDVVEVDEDDVTEFQRPAARATADVTEVRQPGGRRPADAEATQPRRREPKATQPRRREAEAQKVRAPRPARSAPVRPAGSAGDTPGRVTVIPGRSRFHTADCRFARSAEARVVTEATARRRGYEPCNVCMPDAHS